MIRKKLKTLNSFSKIDFAILIFILIIASLLRFYQIDSPLSDHHSWRQVDTAAVARNFARQGFGLLHPRFDDLSNIPSGQYNPQGYRLVEFPLYNALFAFLFKYLPLLSLEVYGRLVTIFFSLVLISVIYYLVLKEEGRLAAVFSSLIFAIFPFFVFYSRVILPEMTALSLIFLAIVSLYLYTHSRNHFLSRLFFLLSVIFSSLSLLVKPMTVFYFLPLLYIFYHRFGVNLLKKIVFYLYFFISLIPLFLWRFWISQYPEGIPANTWLIGSVNTYEGLKNIFLRPAFFRWIFDERILQMILGGYLIVFFVVGIIKKPRQSYLFFWTLMASLIYLFTFQGGNVQHDYYQTLILPSLAILTGVGASFILTTKIFTYLFIRIIGVTVIFLFSLFFSYYKIKDFYHTPEDLTQIAKIISILIPPDKKIITDRNGDTTLLYLADRKGFPALPSDLTDAKQRGMAYVVTAKKEVFESLKNRYQPIFESERVYIFKL